MFMILASYLVVRCFETVDTAAFGKYTLCVDFKSFKANTEVHAFVNGSFSQL